MNAEITCIPLHRRQPVPGHQVTVRRFEPGGAGPGPALIPGASRLWLAGLLFQLLECGLPDLLMLAMDSAQLVVGGVLEREQ